MSINRLSLSLCCLTIGLWASCSTSPASNTSAAPVAAAPSWIDTLHCNKLDLYVTASDAAAYQKTSPAAPDVQASRDNEAKALAAAGRNVKRKAQQLELQPSVGKLVTFKDIDGADGSAETEQYSFIGDMGNMGHWLIRHTMPDFTEWIWIHKKNGTILKTPAYGAISPSGKYYLATVCGGEGSPCNDARLYLYENEETGWEPMGEISLMPSKGWMPDNIKWTTDSTAIAAVVLEEDDEGRPQQRKTGKMPSYVFMEIKRAR